MDYVVQQQRTKQCFRSSLKLWVILTSIASLAIANYARADNSLTTIFYSAGFQGNTELFSRFNWVGQALSAIISMVCLFGLVFMCVRMIFTILYKSNENLFDRIHEIKTNGKSKQFFGMQEVGRDAWNGNLGVGADAIIGFIMSLSIDAKELSDYADGGAARYNLQENDTIAQWFMKVSLSYIVTILFFSAGFSGAIWQAWAVIADAAMVAAQTWIDSDLTQFVDRALNSGATYQFAFDNGTEFGKLKQNIAKSLSSAVLRKSINIDTSTRQALGNDIASWVTENISEDKLAELGGKGTDRDYKNFTYSIVANTSADFGNDENILQYTSNVGSGDTEGSFYFYVILQRKGNADETNYWEFKGSDDSITTAEDETI